MTAPANTMLIPKPAPRDHAAFIPTLPYHEHANLLGNLAARERKALTQIAEAADLLIVEDRPWLLVPASAWLIDTLATLNAECEDRGPYMEDEEQPDDEENHDREKDISDYEPDCDDEYDYRAAPRWLKDRRARAFDAHEKRIGTIAIKELDTREAARGGVR